MSTIQWNRQWIYSGKKANTIDWVNVHFWFTSFMSALSEMFIWIDDFVKQMNNIEYCRVQEKILRPLKCCLAKQFVLSIDGLVWCLSICITSVWWSFFSPNDCSRCAVKAFFLIFFGVGLNSCNFKWRSSNWMLCKSFSWLVRPLYSSGHLLPFPVYYRFKCFSDHVR